MPAPAALLALVRRRARRAALAAVARLVLAVVRERLGAGALAAARRLALVGARVADALRAFRAGAECAGRRIVAVLRVGGGHGASEVVDAAVVARRRVG